MNRWIKIFIIVIIIIAVTAIVAAFFLRQTEPEERETVQEAPRPEIFISDQRVVSPNLSFSGETLWFFDPNGDLSSVPVTGGTPQEFALPPISGFVEAFWQEGTSSFIIRQSVDGHTRYSAYDAEFRNVVEYPDQLKKPRLLFRDEGIVYEWQREDGGLELKTSDIASQTFQTVTDLRRPDYQITPSPAEAKVALFVENQASPERLFLVDLATAEFTPLSNPWAYQGVKFSPDGTKLLALRWDMPDAERPNLYVHDLQEQGVFVLQSRASIDQVAWAPDGSSIYIADSEGIKRTDIVSGATEVIIELSQQQLSPANLLIHPSQRIFFFTDQTTGHLYKAEIR